MTVAIPPLVHRIERPISNWEAPSSTLGGGLMAGFNSPSILFLNTWDKPERDWNGNLFRQALASGYTRYVELYAGAFANCMVAVENGWKPEQIEACDVWAYTAALGYAYSGKPLTEMRATVDGSPVPLSGNAADDAATVIMAQYRMRLSKHEDVDYYRELLADLDINDSEHVGQLRERIAANMVRLGGVKYEATDPMKYAERIMDDPHTIVFANPPTYPGAYEKFFDTGGRFQWTDILNKLEYKTRLAGNRLILVNPAYTSQTCNRCGHVALENRESQAVFQCVNCGNKDNADINAAKNILGRAIHTTGMDDAEGVEGHASRETNVSWESPVETPTPAPRMGRPLH